MSYDWGPHYIVPTEVLKTYSGAVVLREEYDEDLLQKELAVLGIKGNVKKVTNPWYYRKKGSGSWIKIGESENKQDNFTTRWDTTRLKNGQYEIMGLMHVFAQKNGTEAVIARQNIVEVTVENK
jgi:hypothetical protein